VHPRDLGSIGYRGIEGMYVFRDQLHAANADGLLLEYYKDYNASRHKPWKYFDSYSAIDPARLKFCKDTTIHLNAKTYLEVSGDTDGVMIDSAGGVHDNEIERVGRCWDDHWWLAPSCREMPQNCIPVVTAGDGWYIQESMQKAAVYRLPWALAVGRTSRDWEEIGETHRVLPYWWKPTSSFPARQPEQIIFPPYDKQERDQGILISQADRVTLGKWASANLEGKAQPVHSMLARFSPG